MKKAKKLKKFFILMDKSKVLFIIPNIGLGGTTTALASLLNCGVSNHFEIGVFTICRHDYSLQPLVSHDIGMNSLTTAYYGDFSRFNTKEKLKYLFIKLLKQNKRFTEKLENWVITNTIKKIERHKHYDVVVGFQEGQATHFASHFSCPHKIAWIHCDYANTFGKEFDEFGLYNCFETTVCVSHFTRKRFIERYPALAEKTIAIHNIFDAERIVKLSNAAIDDQRYDTSQFTIISLGRVHEVKRFYLIPEIAKQLKAAGLDFRWYILGNAGIPHELQRLTDAIHRNEMEKNVVYLGGKANPYPYLKAADLLVSTSRSEACPMIFNEAKVLHVPILSADFGSAFEFIEEGKDGYITSTEELSPKLIELVSQPNELTSIRDFIGISHTNDEIIDLLVKLFTNNVPIYN